MVAVPAFAIPADLDLAHPARRPRADDPGRRSGDELPDPSSAGSRARTSRTARSALADRGRRRPRRRDRRRRNRTRAAAGRDRRGPRGARALRHGPRVPRRTDAARSAVRRRDRCALPLATTSTLRATVDRAGPDWLGRVGIVTELFPTPGAGISGSNVTAFVCGPERMMTATADALGDLGVPPEHTLAHARTSHGVRRRPVRPLPARHALRLPRRPRVLGRRARTGPPAGGAVMAGSGHPVPPAPAQPDATPRTGRTAEARRLRVGVVKFASCDGCQLTILDLEDELLALTERFEFVEFAEATSRRSSGPFDVLFVEGSISSPEQAVEIVRLRAVDADPRDHRCLRYRGRHPGPSNGRRARGLPSRRVSRPGVRGIARRRLADLRPT